jgi:hypothetical protein
MEGVAFNFSAELGPHVGETGNLTVNDVDLTNLLVEFFNYKKTDKKTTCRFSGTIRLKGTVTVSVGDCNPATG